MSEQTTGTVAATDDTDQPELPGLPVQAFDRWLKDTVPQLLDGQPWRAELISGGLSNLTYRVRFATGDAILRRPPLGPLLPRAHDVAREYRVLAALNGSTVPVPTTYGLCIDPEVLGAPFYLMAAVDGVVLRTVADVEPLTPQDRAELGEQLVMALAALHSVDPIAVGLGDYGKHSGYCARQLTTWGGQWERSRTRELPGMAELMSRLAARLPADVPASIVHGDYRLDNTIIDLTGSPRVAAILDWELSTLGDPLADLGLLLTYWHEAGDSERAKIPVAADVTTLPGFPTGDWLTQRYAELTGRDLSELAFYTALSAMKLAVILEGVHARYLGGKSVGEGYDRAGEAVPILVERGLHHLASKSL